MHACYASLFYSIDSLYGFLLEAWSDKPLWFVTLSAVYLVL